MPVRTKTAWFLAATLFAVGMAYLMWPQLLTNPGHMNMELGGDASKNMFTYVYHSLYGKGAWFTAMNYPYGEHVVYVDAQPVLSVTLAYLREWIAFTKNDIIAILHLFILFSFVLGILFTYKILRSFKAHPILAILFASCIIITSPQIHRVFGHFGLSYLCVIPMIFFWTIRYHNTRRLIYPALIFITGLIASFLHPYFGAVVVIWGGFYSVGYFLLQRRDSVKQRLVHVLPMLGSLIAVYAGIKIIMGLTDPVKDRPITPIGILGNGTTGGDIFYSEFSPFGKGLKALFPGEWPTFDEGYSYIGMAAIVVILLTVVIAIINRKNKNSEVKQLISANNFDPIWVFIAIASLLLGMGVPFVWGMGWLLDYIPIFKQFRSLGRFSWLFYYTSTVFAAVAINYWFVKSWNKNKTIATAGLSLSLVIWAVDCYGYMSYTRERASSGFWKYEAFFYHDDWINFLERNGHKSTDFQAILMLPFLHVGTEKFTLNEGMDWPLTYCMRMAIQLKLPIVDALMSRSSWSQASANGRLAGGPYTDKPILNQGSLPFLLVYFKDAKPDINTDYLLRSSTFIDTFSLFKVYACYPEKIKALDKQIMDSAGLYYNVMTTGDTCINCTGEYFVAHFDTGVKTEKFFSNGASRVINKEREYVTANTFKQPLAQDQLYEFSAWFLVKREDYKIPYCIVDVFNSNGDTLVRHTVKFKPVDSEGLWYRLANFINLPAGAASFKYIVVNEDGPAYTALDELVLMPADALLISKTADGKAMVNNHRYKK